MIWVLSLWMGGIRYSERKGDAIYIGEERRGEERVIWKIFF